MKNSNYVHEVMVLRGTVSPQFYPSTGENFAQNNIRPLGMSQAVDPYIASF